MDKWIRYIRNGLTCLIIFGFLPAGLEALQVQNNQKYTYNEISYATMLDESEAFYKTDFDTKISIEVGGITVEEALKEIADITGLKLTYRGDIMEKKEVTLVNNKISVSDALDYVLQGTKLDYLFSKDGYLLVYESEEDLMKIQAQEEISGAVIDAQSGQIMPGVNVMVKGTTIGTSTGVDGSFALTVESLQDTLVFSFIGYQTQEIPINGRTEIEVALQSQAIAGEELVVVGYGIQEAGDVTGSITKVDVEDMESSNVNIMENLRGSIPGLQIGQVDQAGENPSISIRGRASISGAEDPLIVVDDVIFRGNLIDLNPSDVESVTVLRDASATAVYGSQASNGVVLITTTRAGGTVGDGPVFNFSSSYSFQEPWRELRAQGPQEFMEKIAYSDLEQAYTEESGYSERNPDWPETTNFKTSHEIRAFNANQSFDWYDYVTAENPHTQSHNLSVANRTEKTQYFISAGLTDQQGYIRDEGYSRINARVNLNSEVADWFEIGLQSFITVSDLDPHMLSPVDRYIEPYAHAYSIGEDGQVTDQLEQRPFGNPPNPLIEAQSDFENRRMNLFGNLNFIIDLPLEGLVYRGNLANNFNNANDYFFGPHVSNFQGGGHKNYSRTYDLTTDHILDYKETFNEIHSIDLTFLYGMEKRENEYTNASASNFDRMVLGFNRLQDGASDQHSISTGGWEETSLYSMGRLNYAYDNKYLLTATLRRDGFSGFSEEYKFGYFPSVSVGWVLTEESFFNGPEWLSNLKLRFSYGTTGNRTIGRYETLAQVGLRSGYVSADGTSILTQNISELESPFLKWEKTTGINVGVDFSLLEDRMSGVINYYDKKTTDLLYEVDIPGMTGYDTFSDNLGEIHNRGFEFEFSSVNVQQSNFQWSTDFSFSLNRDKINTLLGFDLDDDGQEDDLVSEGLFIGESLSSIYDYEVDGIWQMDDDIYPGYEFGSYKVVDRNGDGSITPDDRRILGYRDPAYRFGIRNMIRYKNWSLSFFINSIQGGSDRYLGEDTLYGFNVFNNETHFNKAFPKNLDYWTPHNTDARYQRPGIAGSPGISGTRYASRSFVRLQNARLSYDFDFKRLNEMGIQNLTVFTSGRNLYTWTKWNGWDPETGAGIDDGSRPVMRSYTFGIDITF